MLEDAAEGFADGRKLHDVNYESGQAERYEEIGKLQVELDWLKKSCPTRLS